MSLSVAPPQFRSARPHWLAFAVALIWVAAAGWYWREMVPLAPEATFVIEQGKRFEGLSPAGELIMARSNSPRYSPSWSQGPVEFWSLPEGRVVRTAFEPTDQVAPRFHSSDGRTVIRRNGEFWLATLSGEVLHKLPGLEANEIHSSTLRGTRLVWGDETGVVLYDVNELRDVVHLKSSAQQQWYVRGVTKDIVTLHSVGLQLSAELNKHTRPVEWKLVSLSTGEIDDRFSTLKDYLFVTPDDRFVEVVDDKTITFFDRKTAAEVWALDRGDFSNYRFEDEGRILAIDRLDDSGTLTVSRWNVADGTPLGEIHEGSGGNAFRRVIDGTDYAIDFTDPVTPDWKRHVARVFHQLAYLTGTRSAWRAVDNSRNTLIDQSQNRRVGLLTSGQVEVIGTSNGRGVLIREDDGGSTRLKYYRLPPGRSWSWLIQWGIAPPALLLGAIWVRRRRRIRVDRALVSESA